MIYCWYKDRWEKGIDILCKSIIATIPTILIYGLIEMVYLSGNNCAEVILKTITPYIISIQVDKTPWPPLLWPGQMRLIFAEPSFIGNYLAILLPIVLYYYFKDNKNNKLILFYSFFLFVFVFLSKARTANAMSFGIMALFLGLMFFVYKMCYMKKVLLYLCVIVLAFGTSLAFINSTIKNSTNVSYSSYIEENVTSLATTNKRSNSARFARLKSNLRAGMESPVLGGGRGLITAYAVDNFTVDEMQIGEVRSWVDTVNKNGIMLYRIGAMNEYVERFAETGILGLGIFLFPFLYSLKKLFFLYFKNRALNIFLLLIILISSLVSGCNLQLNVIYASWIILGLSFAAINYKESKVKE